MPFTSSWLPTGQDFPAPKVGPGLLEVTEGNYCQQQAGLKPTATPQHRRSPHCMEGKLRPPTPEGPGLPWSPRWEVMTGGLNLSKAGSAPTLPLG